jgi:hypothetical protein
LPFQKGPTEMCYEKCISLKIHGENSLDEQNDNLFCYDVKLSDKMTFEEADKVLYEYVSNREKNPKNEWIYKFYITAKSLRKARINSDKIFETPFLMDSVIAEFSNFASTKFGKYMHKKFYNLGLSDVRLYINPFKFNDELIKDDLIELFNHAWSTSAYYSDFFKIRHFIFVKNNLIDSIKIDEPNIENIQIFSGASFYLEKMLGDLESKEQHNCVKKIEILRKNFLCV